MGSEVGLVPQDCSVGVAVWVRLGLVYRSALLLPVLVREYGASLFVRDALQASQILPQVARTTELAVAVATLESRRTQLRLSLTDLGEKGALRAADRQTMYAATLGLCEETLRNSLVNSTS